MNHYEKTHLLSAYKFLLKASRGNCNLNGAATCDTIANVANQKLQNLAREFNIYGILNLGLPVFIKTQGLEYNDAYKKNIGGYWWPLHNKITKELEVYLIDRNTYGMHDDHDSIAIDREEKNFIVVLPRQPVVKLNFDFLDPSLEEIPF
ncbi:MAG: hypothetical protein ACRBFS_19655 [Aureispira sp.]